MVSTVKSISNIQSTGTIKLELASRKGATQLSGIEIIAAELAN
jgi:hypothetical protein